MNNEETPGNSPPEHHGVAFEPRDINLSRIVALLVIGLGVVAAMFFGVWRFYWFQEHLQREAGQSPYALQSGRSTALPPEPRLEQLERMTPGESEAMNEGLAADEKALHSYGSGGEKGFVRIPIEQAIKALANKLPVDKESTPGRDANGLLDAGQSNSGRMFRGALP